MKRKCNPGIDNSLDSVPLHPGYALIWKEAIIKPDFKTVASFIISSMIVVLLILIALDAGARALAIEPSSALVSMRSPDETKCNPQIDNFPDSVPLHPGYAW